HQINAIRELERKRGLAEKLLFETGCVYMDGLVSDYKKKSIENRERKENGKPIVLLAPSWGDNGLLTKYGAAIVKILVETDFHIILRPHPQSSIVEIKMLEDLKEEFSNE